MSENRPLYGVKVLDLTRWLAGPYATSTLGDMGADVIKVERGSGDGTRHVDRLFTEGMASYFLGLNRNKRSVFIDYQTIAGRELVKRLASASDVLIENFRPGLMTQLGLDYETLQASNPRLIYCSISSFGRTGPLSAKAGMDLVVQAMGGIMGLTGEPDGMPMRAGAPIADFVGAHQALIGILLALISRQTTGLGQRVDIALIDGQISMLANYIPGFFLTGKPDGAVGAGHPQIVPYQLFKTIDGFLVIACLTEAFWQRLCGELKLDRLLADERFLTNVDRVEHRAELLAILEPVIAKFSSTELAARFDRCDIPNAPVYKLKDLAEDEQVRQNEMFLELHQENVGNYHVVGSPVKLSRTPAAVTRPAPILGEHTKEVLIEFGISQDEIEELTRLGIVRVLDEQRDRASR